MPLPLIVMQGHVYLELDIGRTGGGDGEWHTDDGYLMVERYPPGSFGGGGDEFALYLQPR
jgi:hypothetical protein